MWGHREPVVDRLREDSTAELVLPVPTLQPRREYPPKLCPSCAYCPAWQTRITAARGCWGWATQRGASTSHICCTQTREQKCGGRRKSAIGCRHVGYSKRTRPRKRDRHRL